MIPSSEHNSHQARDCGERTHDEVKSRDFGHEMR